MRLVKREYWDRRLYFEQARPASMARYQCKIRWEYENISWIDADVYYKIVPYHLIALPVDHRTELADFIKEAIPGGRLVYDMLLMLYGIEFAREEDLTWFRLKWL